MKVLIVSQYFWPETFCINALARSLRERGVELTVLTGKPNYPEGNIFEGYSAFGVCREHYADIEILRLPTVSRGQRSSLRLFLNYISFIIVSAVLGPMVLRGRAFHVIFVYAPSPILQALPAILLARLKRARLVVWVQDLWPESLKATGHVNSRLLLAVTARVVRMIYRASDRILVQSQAFVAPVSALTEDANKVRYYPNLYQVTEQCEVSSRAGELTANLKSHFSVVFAGNLGTAQSLDTIVGAARELLSDPDIRIVLVGSGRLDQWLLEQRKALGLTNLMLPGRFDPSALPAIFEAAKALLVTLKPEPAFGLTIPSKVQAYLAAGRPILASLDGEGSRIIHEAKAGLCSEAGNAKALAENVRRLWQMTPQERQELGQNGRHYFDRHFAPDVLTDELIKHFRELVDEGGVAA
jgi:glycosyltransferase involved in cell wall biosynthesis